MSTLGDWGSIINAGVGLGNALGIFGDNGAEAANDAAANASNTTAQIARDQWDYYKANYQPLESNLITQATQAGSPDEFARARGAANADVTGAFDTARKNTLSRMQSYGINPGSPAYQSAAASTDIAEGATKAGALTAADNNTRDRAYSKALDVVGLGRNIPAQSSASLASNANFNAVNANRLTTQGNQNIQNIGAGLNTVANAYPTIRNAVTDWFGTSPPSNPNILSGATSMNTGTPGGGASLLGTFKDGGRVGYADGGRIIDAERMGDGHFDATGLKTVMMKHGLNEMNAHTQSHAAAGRHKKTFTPHQKVFANGGGVGRQGMMGMDESNMGQDVSETNQVLQGPGDGTSDSIPAEIDGQEPAALSNGEFVLNAGAMDLTGEEVAQAINEAGLRKRQQAGLTPQNAGMQAYARGGRVACHGL